MTDRQECIDTFYFKHGPCCAGCDWWRSLNSRVGECRKSVPVSADERWSMLNIENVSILRLAGGHIVTANYHHCGDFKDDFDWQSLPLPYRKRIGAILAPPQSPSISILRR